MSYETKSKTLEQIIIALKKKDIEIPINILSDLQSARTLLKVQNTDSCSLEGTEPKIGEYLGNVEAFVISEAEKIFPPEKVDQWLSSIDMAMSSCQSCSSSPQQQKEKEENRFVTGVPRDQQWVRVKPIDGLSADKIENMAAEARLTLKRDENNNLIVYGTKEQIQDFIKQMTKAASK
jgi:hypothetical protein